MVLNAEMTGSGAGGCGAQLLFIELASRLRASLDPGDQFRAIGHALGAGLLARGRSAYGESALELCARLGAQNACMVLLELGADPFEPTQCVDQFGRCARLRAFEAFVASNLSLAIEHAAAGLGAADLLAHEEEWRKLSRDTHPQLRLWRSGGGWMHLAACAGAPDSIRALSGLGLGVHMLDDMGHSALFACARTRAPRGWECACAMLLLGADPWLPGSSGERAADVMPPEWLGMAARAEAVIIEQALSDGAGIREFSQSESESESESEKGEGAASSGQRVRSIGSRVSTCRL